MVKLYFDGVRSRLFYHNGWRELRNCTDLREARRWCRFNGVHFVDHRIENYPWWLRDRLLRARGVLAQDYPRLGLRDLGRQGEFTLATMGLALLTAASVRREHR